jgi:Flp pilus assembly protein TadG
MFGQDRIMSTLIRKRLATSLRNFAADRSGNLTMVMGLSAVPFLLAVGVAVDYSRGVTARTGLQQISDAAALAAAAPASATTDERKSIALNYIDANDDVLAGIDIKDKTVTVGPNTVDVALTANIEGTIVKVGESSSGSGAAENGGSSNFSADYDVGSKSKAAYGKDGLMCLMSLNSSAYEAVKFYGNTEFMASSCSVQANSTNSTAMITWGSAYAEASTFCAVGGWKGSGFEPDPTGGCPVKTDPYASLAMPSTSVTVRSNSQLVIKNQTMTLDPGVYKGGISIQTGGKAILNPGTYVIQDGGFLMSSSAQVTGTGVTIYMYGNGPTTGSGKNPSIIDIGSQSTVYLKAPTSGTYAGIAIIQDKNSNANDVAGTTTITSGGNVNIIGAVYMPKQTLKIWASGDMNVDSSYFPIITDKFEMNGSGTLHVNIDYAAAGFPKPDALVTKGYLLLTQ